MHGRAILAVVGLIFLGVGIGLAIGGNIVLNNAKASASWPQVEASITASEVQQERSRSGTGRDRRTRTTYRAQVAYEYTVDGTTHSCDRVSFGQYGSSDPGHAQEIVSRYPVGKGVRVHYDPARPEVAVLEPGVSWSSYVLLAMGVLFLLVGLVTLGGALAAKGRPRRLHAGVDAPDGTGES